MDNINNHYQVITLGTSVPNSILAMLLSKKYNHQLLTIDSNAYYGGLYTSFTNVNHYLSDLFQRQESASINQLKVQIHNNLVSSKDQLTAQINKTTQQPQSSLNSREYTIETNPKLILANSNLIKLITTNNLQHNLELIKLDNMTIYHDHNILEIPLNKGQIFKTKAISLKEKNQLMKFIRKVVLNEEANQLEDLEQEIIVKHNLPIFIYEIFTELIVRNRKFGEEASLAEIIKEFIISNQMYNLNANYLSCLYGTGHELSQSFCRGAAINGGLVMLSSKVNEIDLLDKKILVSYNGNACKTIGYDLLVCDLEYLVESEHKTLVDIEVNYSFFMTFLVFSQDGINLKSSSAFLQTPKHCGLMYIVVPKNRLFKEQDCSIDITVQSNYTKNTPKDQYLISVSVCKEVSNQLQDLYESQMQQFIETYIFSGKEICFILKTSYNKRSHSITKNQKLSSLPNMIVLDECSPAFDIDIDYKAMENNLCAFKNVQTALYIDGLLN